MVGAAREDTAARRGVSIRLMPRAIDVEKTVLGAHRYPRPWG